MKIYFAHPRHGFDYEKELYQPIRSSALNKRYEIILPHETDREAVSSKEIIKICDLLCAEVSNAATGVGIEIGWANASDKPILCFYKKGSDISGSLKYVAREVIEYKDVGDFIVKLDEFLKRV